jgi:hypothetical protein
MTPLYYCLAKMSVTHYPRKFVKNDPLICFVSAVDLNKKMVASFVHYIIAPERVDDHITAVQKLFRSLKQDKISGVHYSIFLLGENVFIHLVECRREGFIDNFNKRADVIEFLEGMVSRLLACGNS